MNSKPLHCTLSTWDLGSGVWNVDNMSATVLCAVCRGLVQRIPVCKSPGREAGEM